MSAFILVMIGTWIGILIFGPSMRSTAEADAEVRRKINKICKEWQESDG